MIISELQSFLLFIILFRLFLQIYNMSVVWCVIFGVIIEYSVQTLYTSNIYTL